jgi:hypothetical protein
MARLLGRAVCRAGGCGTTVDAGLGGRCHRCFAEVTGQGLARRRVDRRVAAVAAAPSWNPTWVTGITG